MFYRTSLMQFPFALAAALATALSTRPAAALLTTPTLRLFTDSALTITPGTDVAAFTEATFGGYSPVTLGTMIGPVLAIPNQALVHVQGDFAADGTIGAGQTCYGYVVTDAASVGWYLAENFVDPVTGAPAPMNFAQPGDFLSIDSCWGIPDVLLLNT